MYHAQFRHRLGVAKRSKELSQARWQQRQYPSIQYWTTCLGCGFAGLGCWVRKLTGNNQVLFWNNCLKHMLQQPTMLKTFRIVLLPQTANHFSTLSQGQLHQTVLNTELNWMPLQSKMMLAEGVQSRWVHSGAQVADCLTKIMETSFLRENPLSWSGIDKPCIFAKPTQMVEELLQFRWFIPRLQQGLFSKHWIFGSVNPPRCNYHLKHPAAIP